MGNGSVKRAHKRAKAKRNRIKVVRTPANLATTSPLTNQTENTNKISEKSNEEPEKQDRQTNIKRPLPWIYGVFGVCIIFSPFVLDRHSLVLAWTQDSPINWNAQAIVFYLGIFALFPFVHALAAAQALGSSRKYATKEDRELSRVISERALSWVSIGILTGILYALFSINALQHSFKVTSVISDVSIVGGISGLVACMPYNIKVTFVTMRRLRKNLPKRWLRVTSAFGIMDIFLISKLVGLPQFISHLVH